MLDLKPVVSVISFPESAHLLASPHPSSTSASSKVSPFFSLTRITDVKTGTATTSCCQTEYLLAGGTPLFVHGVAATRGMAAALFSDRQNTGSVAASGHTSVMTPSPPTPRPNTAPDAEPKKKADDASTPTRATFKSPAHGQKPLPKDAFPQAVQIPEAADNSKSDSPHRTPQSQARDSMEMDIDESDGEGEAGDDVGSDDDSVSADGTRSSKKKKSQRFYCTDFPPCSLSFTRSEHLARHIR